MVVRNSIVLPMVLFDLQRDTWPHTTMQPHCGICGIFAVRICLMPVIREILQRWQFWISITLCWGDSWQISAAPLIRKSSFWAAASARQVNRLLMVWQSTSRNTPSMPAGKQGSFWQHWEMMPVPMAPLSWHWMPFVIKEYRLCTDYWN